MKNTLQFSVMLAIFFCSSATIVGAQVPVKPSPSPSPTASVRPHRSIVRDVLDDQKVIWTAPFRMDRGDMKFVLPATAGLAALIATDRHTSGAVPRGGNWESVSKGVSWGGSAAVDVGVAAGFYMFGRGLHNPRARETGRLVAETLVDSAVVVTVLKNVTQRLRPNSDGGSGEFFEGGSSFPSGHSASAWSVATIVALEYRDKPLVKYTAIAAATAVSIARYTGRNHFLSDIAVGSAIGIYTGRFVYKRRHDGSLDEPDAPETTRLMPMLIPEYDRRSATYGIKAVWRL